MDRRTRTIVIAAVAAMVVLVLAASSGSSPIWEVPDDDVTIDTVVVDQPEIVQPQEPTEDGRREVPSWFATVTRVVAVVLAVILVMLVLAAATLTMLPGRRRGGRRRFLRRHVGPLPEVDDGTLEVDVGAARAALTGGTPRNAIVACWMQLEADAGSAGLSRLAAETPAEYVERVVATSSVDPAPIAELAALYREARFSQHELSDDHRQRAMAALDRVAAALGHDVESPA